MPQTTPFAAKFTPNPYSGTRTHYKQVEECRLLYHNNNLVSGSLEALIQHLVPTVDYYPDRSYIFTFLLSSRLFLHPFELMSRVCYLCVEHHRVGDPQIDKKRIRDIAPRIVQLLTEWTETFPYDFRDERMMRSLKEMTHRLALGDELSRRAMQRLIQRLLRKMTILGQYEETIATPAATQEKPASQKAKQHVVRREECVLSVCDDPFVLAQQLTHIEMERLSYIGPEEFIQAFVQKRPSGSRKVSVKRRASNLEAYVEWFNRLSYLVATEICLPVKKKHRARVLEFFIDVARECFNIGNFNSMMAIITGMNMSPVARLKKTWSKVNTDKFEILEHQMDPSNNFYNYRTALRGATQRSSTAHTAREKVVHPSLVPMPHKFWELAKQVSEFLAWRQVICPFERNRTTLQYLISISIFTEDELQLASYESEGPENSVERDTRRSLRWSLAPETFCTVERKVSAQNWCIGNIF
uniref:RasGEF domain family, member 1Bb n=1 Tax=Electrophorus electricus TaxID=8005 RepID=A0AAY5EQG0_ELEEL